MILLALSESQGLVYTDIKTPNLVDIDVSDVLAEVIKLDNVLLSRIGMGGESIETPEYYWIENSLTPNEGNTAADTTGDLADTADTSLIVTAGEGTNFRAGTMFVDKAAGKTEVMLVTAVATDTLTITRGYGNSSPETHGTGGSGFAYRILANPLGEYSSPQNPSWKVRSRVENFTQIFERTLGVSESEQQTRQFAVSDELAKQLKDRTMEIKEEMNLVLVNGRKGTWTDAAGVTVRTTGGIVDLVDVSGGNQIDADDTTAYAADTVSATMINDGNALIDVYEGASPKILAGSRPFVRSLSRLTDGTVFTEREDTQRGTYVRYFRTDTGNVLELVGDNAIRDEVFLIIDPSKIKFRPFRNLKIKAFDLGKDAIERRVIGEYGVEVRNATQAHAIIKNCSAVA